MPPNRYTYWTTKLSQESSQELLKFKLKLAQFEKKDIQLRIEYNRVSIFCNDKNIFKDLEITFDEWLDSIWEPATEKEESFLIDHGRRKHVCKKYPKGLYQYKIFFNKKALDSDNRASFYEWFTKYNINKVDAPAASRKWLNGFHVYVDSPYMYVSDQKMLSLVCLRLGKGVRLIKEFVLEDNINTA